MSEVQDAGVGVVAVVAAAGSLDPQGPVAEAMAALWRVMLGLGAAVFALFAVLLVVGLLRRPDGPEGRRGPNLKWWLVGGGVVLPFAVITLVFGATLVAMRATPTRPPPDALVVDIVGHQFSYEVSYPKEGIEARDELRIPVGRPVALRLTSADVIHSFWVPELGGKMDMLPDGVNTLVLQADVPGEHRARCAEFCGLEHAHMELRVIAEPPEQFASWLAAQP